MGAGLKDGLFTDFCLLFQKHNKIYYLVLKLCSFGFLNLCSEISLPNTFFGGKNKLFFFGLKPESWFETGY